jgi:hypothetical protein
MKHLLLFAAVLCCAQTFAQDTTKLATKKAIARKYPAAIVGESSRTMSLGEGNALTMTLTNTEAKMVAKIWTRQLKDTKAKVNTNKQDEIFADNASISGFDGTADVYTKITQVGKDCEVVAFFSTEEGFVQSQKMMREYQLAGSLLTELDRQVSIAKVNEELEMEQKTFKKFEKEQKNLEQDLEEYKSLVEKKKKEIIELEQKQVDNQKAQVIKKEEIATQSRKVAQVTEELKKY